MTQEEKELLIKDLCGRLPYGVIVETQLVNAPIAKYPVLKVLQSHMLCDFMQTIENVIHKPYLFPLSSMTEEQRKEYESLCIKKTSECTDLYDIIFAKDYYDTIESIDWLNKNHFDYRGLIPLGLAINCTNLNIY